MPETAPKQLIAITYGDVFPKEKLPSFENLLKDVPTIVLLRYITHEHQKVHYTMYAPDVHLEVLTKMIRSFHSKAKQNACIFLQRNRGCCILMDTVSTMHLCFESLKNFVSIDSYDDLDLEPTEEELDNIYRAYLLCNTEWTEHQLCPGGSITDMLLKIDVPFSEFIFHKDIECQLYKAFKFFSLLRR